MRSVLLLTLLIGCVLSSKPDYFSKYYPDPIYNNTIFDDIFSDDIFSDDERPLRFIVPNIYEHLIIMRCINNRNVDHHIRNQCIDYYLNNFLTSDSESVFQLIDDGWRDC